ncbi:MAG: CGNR zinc finger domain-containing protein [Candidatus Eremiobacteraeota bacterium]|nr:CGNR zinc finger domain-containing protein [Candidatus Eremiobacteraeota bacterium]
MNTASFDSGREDLSTAESARSWIEAVGLPYNELGEGGLYRLRDLREAFRELLLAQSGQGDLGAARRRLAGFVRDARLRLEWGTGATPVLRPDESAPNVTESALLAIMYDSMADGTWLRMKACRKESCRWAFFDGSKNGSGAWCSMAICGNRVKAQRRRARETKVGP